VVLPFLVDLIWYSSRLYNFILSVLVGLQYVIRELIHVLLSLTVSSREWLLHFGVSCEGDLIHVAEPSQRFDVRVMGVGRQWVPKKDDTADVFG